MLQEWRKEQWSDIQQALHPQNQSLWRMTEDDKSLLPQLLRSTRGGVLSASKKAEVLADTLEA